MGISEKLLKKIDKYIKPNKSIIEIGSQSFWINKQEEGPTKPYFESKGIDYTSIDLNGKNDSLQLDLCCKVDLPQSNIVTNFGTSEHVKNQYMCFKNMYDLCKVNGLMIHEIPEVGGWLDHRSLYWYTESFLKDVYKRDEIIELCKIKYEPGYLIFCVVKKKCKEFINESRFNSISN